MDVIHCHIKMPLNIRAKPPQSKLSAASKSSGHTAASTSHSRFSKPPKQTKSKALTSTPGCRSGLEPGSVSGGAPVQGSKRADQGLRSRSSSRIKQGTAPDKPTNHGSATAPGGKTLSMENIQSISAAYATSGTTYPNECEALEHSGGYPKGTMTLGRSAHQSSYTGRTLATGSSPNINSSGSPHQSEHYGDQTTHADGPSSVRRQSGRYPQTLQDSAGRGEASTFDLHAQLRDLRRENDHLKRELDGGREVRMGPNMNSSKVWSPEMKRDRGVRREDRMRTSILKDQYRTNQEDLQVSRMTEYILSSFFFFQTRRYE